MTLSLERFACPTCGALMGSDPTLGAVRCDFCGRRAALAEDSLASPRVRIPPGLDSSEAALALRRTMIESGVLPKSLRGEVEPVDLRLLYVPYLAARGIRLGIVERKPEARTEWVTEVTTDGAVSSRHEVRRRPEGPGHAKVVATDVEWIGPGVRKAEWGLESLDVGGLIARGAAALPYDPGEIRGEGSVLVADVGRDDALSWLSRQAGAAGTTLAAPSVRTILVPVWRVRYRIGGCLYDATLDAVEGRLLAARSPENDRYRIPIALGYVAAASLALGVVLRGTGWLLAAGAHAYLFVAGAFLMVLAMFGTYAWNVVRYDSERVWGGGRVWSEYLNKPPSTRLERFWERLFEKLSETHDRAPSG